MKRLLHTGIPLFVRHSCPSCFEEIVLTRVQSGQENNMWFRGVILKKANSPPRITARRGAGVTKKMARSLLIDAAGVVFLVRSIGTPPCPRKKRMLRNIFLIARPPLLAVMREGEFALLKMAPNLDSCAFHGEELRHLRVIVNLI